MSDTAPEYVEPSISYDQGDLAALAPFLLILMMRNITSDGFRVEDPMHAGVFSLPGCVIAAPSFPANTANEDQDYIFNWVRDAAITAIEIAAWKLPTIDNGVSTLINYINFATTCRNNAQPTPGHACFTVNGQSRDWTEQSDGPALQILAILQAYSQLDPPTRTAAAALVAENLVYLLGADQLLLPGQNTPVYQSTTTNLWEEHVGLSFFARSVQLRCFREIVANTIGLPVPASINTAIAWLESALNSHWNGSLYVSLMVPGSNPPASVTNGYDANIDIVSACVYGAVPCTDTKLLATAAILREQWADPSQQQTYYPINGADQARGMGPLFGRYPADVYNGDVANPGLGDHPWALCTANFAELHYRLASEISSSGSIPFDAFSAAFFKQLGIASSAKASDAVTALRTAGDNMLQAVIFHSDHYELSEQFDGITGYERSVKNLTWSYAAFLSALRARAS
jgi:glucoamylase